MAITQNTIRTTALEALRGATPDEILAGEAIENPEKTGRSLWEAVQQAYGDLPGPQADLLALGFALGLSFAKQAQ